jgi:hypothetical protein
VGELGVCLGFGAPTSVGFAQIIYGEHKGREAIVESGHRLVKIGLTIL